MPDNFTLQAEFPVSPLVLYATWLSSVGHTDMTGGEAHCPPGVGARFTAWDGYISGCTLELDPGRRIVQSWRTLEFAEDAADSRIELTLQEIPGGTRLILVHGNIPAGQGDRYRAGWDEHYFAPMREYFGGMSRPEAAPVAPRSSKPTARRKPARKQAKKASRKALKKPPRVATKKAAKAHPKKAAKARRARKTAKPGKPKPARKAARQPKPPGKRKPTRKPARPKARRR